MIAKNKSTPDESYPKSTEYKGRKIKFSDLPNSDLQNKIEQSVEEPSDKGQMPLRVLKVEIDDKAFEVREFSEGTFESILLPYSLYSSPVDLAKDVIDNVPAFRH